MPSPFVVGPPVVGDAHFGRHDLLRDIRTSDRECWCVIGLRRFGKTSLLKQLAHLVRKDGDPYFPLYLSFEGKTDQEQIRRELLMRFAEVEEDLERIGLQYELLQRVASAEGLFGVLNELMVACRRTKQRLLLLCDECEALKEIGESDPRLLQRLRSAFQMGSLVKTVITGSREILGLDSVDALGSAFLHGFEPVEWLRPLSHGDIKARVGAALDISRESLAEILRVTDGHPYFVQAILYELYEQKSQKSPVQLPQLTKARDRVTTNYDYEMSWAFGQDYQYLSNDEQTILGLLIKQEGRTFTEIYSETGIPKENLKRLLAALDRSRYLRKQKWRYWFACEFFKDWLTRKQQTLGLKSLPPKVKSKSIAEAIDKADSSSPLSKNVEYAEIDILIGQDDVQLLESPVGSSGRYPLQNEAFKKFLALLDPDESGEGIQKQVGAGLFNSLVADHQIRDLFRQSQATGNLPGKGYRVRLRIDSDELHSIPWELMYDEHYRRFLSRSPRTPMSRYLHVAKPAGTLEDSRPLRVLVVAADPVDAVKIGLDELDIPAEQELIRTALEEWGPDYVDIRIMDHAVVRTLRKAVLDFDPHVVHFIGHGWFAEQNDEGYLILENEKHCAKSVRESELTELLDSASIGLVVLNVCRSASTYGTNPLAGLAPCLVASGIPAAVAMAYNISDADSAIFSAGFYGAIARNMPVDAAVAEGRKSICTTSDADQPTWYAPVLFMQNPSGRIVEFVDSP